MPVKPPIFRPSHLGTVQEGHRRYERGRGSARQRGYDARWERASLAFKIAHPLCLGCEAIGRIEPTVIVDHVVPPKGDMVRFWDETQWQPACKWHHDVVKQRLEVRWAAGELAASALWLNSPTATTLSRQLIPGEGA